VSDELTTVLATLTEAVEDADPRLKTRKEYRSARDWLRDRAGDEAEDEVRQARAHLDMLALLQAEIDDKSAREEAEKARRRTEDAQILKRLQGEFRLYSALILAGFLIPPFLFAPFPKIVAVGIIPPLWGFLRVRGLHSQLRGRQWIVLLDTVEEHTGRLKFADWIALGCMAIVGLWTLVALTIAGSQGG